MPPEKGCVVYFVQMGDTGPIKIGVTDNVGRRVGELQVGNPHRLHLRRTVPGTERHESKLHARFHDHRMRGEWFHPVPDLLELLDPELEIDWRDLSFTGLLDAHAGRYELSSVGCVVCGVNLQAAYRGEPPTDQCVACIEAEPYRELEAKRAA